MISPSPKDQAALKEINVRVRTTALEEENRQ